MTTLAKEIELVQSVTALGHFVGKSPCPRKLLTWGRSKLHRSFKKVTICTNNCFEIEFDHSVGCKETLHTRYYELDGHKLTITEWSPYFEQEGFNPNFRGVALWAQVVGLLPMLRTERQLREIISTFTQVLEVETVDTFRSKLSGPRVRILTNNDDELPKTIIPPRIDGKGETKHLMEYSGLPTQCGRCRSFDHTVSICPQPRLPYKDRIVNDRARKVKRGHPPHLTAPSGRPMGKPGREPRAVVPSQLGQRSTSYKPAAPIHRTQN